GVRVVPDGSVEVLFALQGDTAVVECFRILRVLFESFGVVSYCAIHVTFRLPCVAAIVIGERYWWRESCSAGNNDSGIGIPSLGLSFDVVTKVKLQLEAARIVSDGAIPIALVQSSVRPVIVANHLQHSI